MLFVILTVVLRKKCHIASYLKNLSTGPVARPRTERQQWGPWIKFCRTCHGSIAPLPCEIRQRRGFHGPPWNTGSLRYPALQHSACPSIIPLLHFQPSSKFRFFLNFHRLKVAYLQDMDDPSWAWLAWKFDIKRENLFTKLHDQYNTYPSAIQDSEAFYHDITEISCESQSIDEFHQLASDRRQRRFSELNKSLESASFKTIGNPNFIKTPQ